MIPARKGVYNRICPVTITLLNARGIGVSRAGSRQAVVRECWTASLGSEGGGRAAGVVVVCGVGALREGRSGSV